MKVTVIPIVIRTLGTVFKNLEKRLCEYKIKGTVKYIRSTIEICKFTKRSPGDLRRFTVPQASVKSNQNWREKLARSKIITTL